MCILKTYNNLSNNNMYIFIGFIIINIIYLLYIQFSPEMGEIWYRNNKYFCFNGAWKVIIFPLSNEKMWCFEMWDINYFIWLILYTILVLFLQKHQKYYFDSFSFWKEYLDDKIYLLTNSFE